MYDRRPIKPFVETDADLDDYLCKHIANFKGDAADLQSALGALVLGRHLGLRALRIMHSPATIRKYDRVLGIKLKNGGAAQNPSRRQTSGNSIRQQDRSVLGCCNGTEDDCQQAFL